MNDRIFGAGILLILIVVYIIGVFVGAVFSPCKADSFELHLGSKHLGPDRDYNEINPGIGYRKDFSALYATAGAYYGSESKPIGYAAFGYDHRLTSSISIGAELGVVSGYSQHPVSPMAAPFVSIGGSEYRFKVRALPLVYKSELEGAVLTFSLDFLM